MTTILEPAPAKATHATRLAAAAARTAAARAEVDSQSRLAATVADLKARAAAGELDDKQALDFSKKAEALRLGEITAPRRQRALDDALAAEVREALAVLSELGQALEPVKHEAASVADRLTAAMLDPLALEVRGDSAAGYQRDTARTILEGYSVGTYRANLLADRIATAAKTTWGASHVPQAAAGILTDFDNELVAIRAGIAALRAALATLEKLSA